MSDKTFKPGDLVEVDSLSHETEIAASPEYLKARRPSGHRGRVINVSSFGSAGNGKIVWVDHYGSIAPYTPFELRSV